MLAEILENTRKTKSYIKWQIYITLVLVVLPLIVALFLVPFMLRSIAAPVGAVVQ